MDLKDTQQIHTDSNGQSYTGQAVNGFYQKASTVSFIAKKTERIATAIYMVTDFLADSEPLKIELRTLAISLISTTQKLPKNPNEIPTVLASDCISLIDQTMTFLSLATTLGLVSEMNGKILETELKKVQSQVDENSGEKKLFIAPRFGFSNVLLNQEMFVVEKDQEAVKQIDKGHELIKGQTNQENVFYKKDAKSSQVLMSVSKKSELGSKIARRNDVLSIVRNKGKVSIKDISEILKDIGDKTLQRELHGLVQEGVLIKEGEKRWTLYKIAN